MIHKAFRTHTALQTKPIRESFHIHYLPKLYIGFKDCGEEMCMMG